ncbi:gp53-like domain-containing protein [Citrobacter freundii]
MPFERRYISSPKAWLTFLRFCENVWLTFPRIPPKVGIRESKASLQIGSLIIKFGNSGATVPVSGYQFSFPTPFPNACYALVVTGWQRPIGHTGRNKVGATLTTTDNIASIGFDYIAIGG